jgi:hypothetical protein
MAARDVTAAQGLAYPVPVPKQGGRVDTGAERVARTGAAKGLVGLMVLGSLALWTAVPLGGLWLASQLTGSVTRLEAAPALVVLVGMPVAMALGGMGLARLECRYLRLTGTTRARRVPAYRRSVSDSSSGPEASVLDKITVVSVLTAAVAFAGWFFLFAGSSLPA